MAAAASSSSVNAFGFSLFRLLNEDQPDRDVAISPLSLKACLDLVASGATKDSACEQEMLAVLGSIQPAPRDNAMDTATSAWVRSDIRSDYLKSAEDNYGAKVFRLDGTDPTPINEWAQKHTEGRIQQLFEKLSPTVVMVLANTVFFKGSWLQPFDPNETQRSVFKSFAGDELPCDLMYKDEKKMLYAEVAGFQAAQLAYDGEGMCATILLPLEQGVEAMARAAGSLTSEFWMVTLPEALTRSHVKLHLPRFNIAFGEGQPWEGYLQGLGLATMFDLATRDKFLRMSDDPEVSVGQVAHRVTITVDEEGTVASAAAAVEMMSRCIPPPPTPMRVDRPFLFVISDRHRAVAFAAKVASV